MGDDEAMTRYETILPGLRVWFRENADSLSNRGVSVSLNETRAYWDDASMWLDFDVPDFAGRITVWDTGAAELECAAIATEYVRHEHRELRSVEDLYSALNVLLEWLHINER
jgi:hypothetical protein